MSVWFRVELNPGLGLNLEFRGRWVYARCAPVHPHQGWTRGEHADCVAQFPDCRMFAKKHVDVQGYLDPKKYVE